MDAEKLVPDSLVSKLLFQRISEPDASSGYILDGYPRSLSQAKELSQYLDSKSDAIVINLDVKDATILERIIKRARESKGERSDDTPEIAKERLKVYYDQTKPVIDYYKNKGQLITIDGEKGSDSIFNEILTLYRKP